MMKRRQFLDATIAAGATLLWPTWLKQAFGDPATCGPEGASRVASAAQSAASLSQAFRNARRAGRPLLVIVIPSDDSQKYERGRAWGELLNFGSDEQLAPLSSVDVACATMDALRLVVPSDVTGEPFFAVVSTDATPSSLRGFQVELPGYEDAWRDDTQTWEERTHQEDLVSQKRIAALARVLRIALGTATGDLAARAADVRTRIKNGPPAGAHWARSSGCGMTIEGVEQRLMVACGMGHVPEQSRRFLYFFSIDRSHI
jgi:hypothetical protein